MDRLKLVMLDGQRNQRVNVAVIVNIAFPVGEQIPKQPLTGRRGKDNLPGAIVRQYGTRRNPDIHIDAIDRAAYLDSRARR